MNNKFDLVLGIEIHVQTKTNSKMFSSSKNKYNDSPNTNINQFDLGYPGTKPLVNKKAVEHAIRLATALKMTIPKLTSFDRKHYFYPDLPKGFQITQFYHPIGKNGILKLSNGKEIKITQIHMEEDTAKQIHKDGTSFIDYNRAGTPLIEIVTDHTTIKNSEDAMLFVKTLRSLIIHHNISNAKMNEGSMRCDINISIKPKGSKKLGNKVEIKNINSISNIKIAIEKEVQHQINDFEEGKTIEQATKRFDDKKNDVVLMRTKTSDIDYLYFRETNIPSILITNLEIKSLTKNDVDFNEYVSKISNIIKIDESKVLDFMDKPSFELFKKISNEKINLKIAYNLFESVIAQVLNNNKVDIKSINSIDIINLVNARSNNKLSQSQVGEIFQKLISKKINVKNEIEKLNDSKVSSDDIENIINKLIKDNQATKEKYKDRPENFERFLMGQLMKVTKGNVNPKEAMDKLKILLNN